MQDVLRQRFLALFVSPLGYFLETHSNNTDKIQNKLFCLFGEFCRRVPTKIIFSFRSEIMPPLSKSKALQPPKKGSIHRIKLENFMTYRNVEFHPGPGFNVILGTCLNNIVRNLHFLSKNSTLISREKLSNCFG